MFFATELAVWARNLPSALRTGYLVPVVTHDSSPGDAEETSSTDRDPVEH